MLSLKGLPGLRIGFIMVCLLGLFLAFGQLFAMDVHNGENRDPFLPPEAQSKQWTVPKEQDHVGTLKGHVGTFNGVDLVYKEQPIDSSVHCIGESYKEDAWVRRSCEFRNLCFDVKEKEFVLFQSPRDVALNDALQKASNKFIYVSTTTTFDLEVPMHVAIGGLNPKWTEKGCERLKWFPRVITPQNESLIGYYELPQDTIWIPFHSLAAFNPGHLVWDDFLPVYTLLSMFGHLDKNTTTLLMRDLLNDGEPGLWASCDFNEGNKANCQKMIDKFLPLMGIDPNTFSTSEDFQLHVTDAEAKSNYVCARRGLAGMGLLTDHGIKMHGWDQNDYKTTHNHARGGELYRFRNFMIDNMGLQLPKVVNPSPPYKITFSVHSTQRGGRRVHFRQQMTALEKQLGNGTVVIQSYVMSKLSLEEQVKIASESAIFVSACGGGAVTASFVPKGSSVILYFDETGGVERGRQSLKPARLDWDLFNNAAYIRSHWLPARSMDRLEHVNAFVQLVKHELEIIASQG